jgi:methionyl-tRNA formyltransferase
VRLIFAGTPQFAAEALRTILADGHDVPLVLTQPDRPAGRGMQIGMSDVKRVALASGIPVEQPPTLRSEAAVETLRRIDAQVMVVAAYGLILPPAVLELFPRGCLNIHASLLPRWRGAAPIQRAILAGDALSGVCIMQMEVGLDTGPVLRAESLALAADETAGSLHDRLALLGARLIVEVLRDLAHGPVQATPQDDAAATYAAKIGRSEAALDFSRPAAALGRQVRAFNPYPGAWAMRGAEIVKIWRAQPLESGTTAAPGEVVATSRAGVDVACGGGTLLRLMELQRPGGRRLLAEAFLQGFPLRPGDRFGGLEGSTGA